MGDRVDLAIVGMGSGGMVAAEFACGLGIRVAVIERDRVGGDCLWTGCVPSKALLASARVAHSARTASAFGVSVGEVVVDTAAVWQRIRAVQGDIALTDDDPQRYEDMGVTIVPGEGRLTSATTVAVEGPDGTEEIEARYVLLATGSRPAVPPIDGLIAAGFLTSESVFDLDEAPESLILIGGGPISVELSQAFRRLGVRATVLQRGPEILPRDERDLAAMLRQRLVDEGVEVVCGVSTDRVTVEEGRKVVHGRVDGAPGRWSAAEILVAAGRRPNVEGLGLAEVGIEVGDRGVIVDDRLRSSVPTVYAAGDVAGRYLFTHSAAYEAVRAVRDMFFPGKGRANEAVPWCTFTDPELAHAGLTVAEAEERYGDDVHVWRQDLTHSDRARADGATDGAIVVVTVKGKVVGAHILAPAAGEMIHELALAIREGMSFSSLGSLVHIYPTYATGVFQLAGDAAFERAESFRWLVRKGKR